MITCVGDNNTYSYLALILGSLLGIIRMAEGGHFLSDVIFSNLVIIFLTGAVYYFYQKYYAK